MPPFLLFGCRGVVFHLRGDLADGVNVDFDSRPAFVDFALNFDQISRGDIYAVPVVIVDFNGNAAGFILKTYFSSPLRSVIYP